MRRLILTLMVGALLVIPTFVSAQTNVSLSSVTVQLWPEYDQPSMLVIVDFLVDPAVSLPVDLTFRIPNDANLIAVAVQSGDRNFLNAEFSGPQAQGEWQVFTMPISQKAHYRFEYYQPLAFNGNQRTFSYLWDNGYAVDAFQVSVLEPMNVISFKTTPSSSSEVVNGLNYYASEVVRLAGSEQYAFNLQYEKSSDALSVPPQGLQPVAPVDDTTPGRVSFNNSLPYIIGGLGVILILGGIVYYLQAGRTASRQTRRRRNASATVENSSNEVDAYCPQCGTRAKAGDRFCRTCGARLRQQDG
ncbi:MAG: hypothetical protein KJZ77_05905 [Anaerolineales bacterium]|nr:hypothetical protein [Anaerolineales bacterium]